MVDRKLVKEEMKKRCITQYKPIVPSLSRLKKLFCKYEVETMAECYYDACRKIAILTSLADGRTVNFEEITTEGITKISNEDFAYARKLNSVI